VGLESTGTAMLVEVGMGTAMARKVRTTGRRRKSHFRPRVSRFCSKTARMTRRKKMGSTTTRTPTLRLRSTGTRMTMHTRMTTDMPNQRNQLPRNLQVLASVGKVRDSHLGNPPVCFTTLFS